MNLGGEPISSQGDYGASSGEVRFADGFEAYVSGRSRRSSRRCIPRFAGFYREISGTVGIADFIGVVAPRWSFTERRLRKRLNGLSRGPIAEILSQLEYKRGISRQELINSSQYTRSVVSTAVHGLLKAKVIRCRGGKEYLLHSNFKFPCADIYFYEIKMENWRRALFQASQSLVYADKAYCVMPMNKRQLLLNNRHLFQGVGVGVILFDPACGKVVEVIPGRKRKPKKPADKLDVLIRLASAQNLIEQVNEVRP